ncbi:NUC091 domain-containing protein [Rhodocollybia butyracea]|uniref:Nucleolar GTP-binding protein 2 n=1 Tax=Rhodocollybia butyracea TaxID=206335 RepID=A0A9P5TWF4_9AGAR|nr:NUC091 domain-containing protein [Rhodocollybia butyracea]
MAPSKKSGDSSKTRSSTSSSTISLKRVKGENFYRNAKQASRLKMLNGGKPIRDKDGKIIQAAAFQKGEDETKPGRVQPDRRWFGNTRVISQKALDHFRTSLETKKDDPYSVLLRRNKLPMALLDDAANPHTQKRSHIVETEPFSDTFGPKAQRKRPRIDAGDFEELSKFGAAAAEEAEVAATAAGHAIEPLASSIIEPQTHADYNEPIYAKGTSRRIYDSSDVILHILDARDPMGTLCESAHKQVVLVINKCDLVPNWVTARYIQHLTPRYPTIAFHAYSDSFSQLHSDKKQISVGFVGYPNVGKSSFAALLPVPGETKVWQYITLTRRIYLIDCPGIVPTSAHDTQTSTVLKGVVRVEALPTPSDHIPALMTRVKPLYISLLLDKLARMKGRLLKHGEPDMDSVAKIILSDWAEEKAKRVKAKANDPKGKAVAEEEEGGGVPGVRQNLGSIMQKNTFLAEDIQPLEMEFAGESVDDENPDGSDDEAEEEGADRNEDKEDKELTWNDVFEGIKHNDDEHVSVTADDANENEDEGDEQEQAPSKEPRMSTNKRKATNFYSNANVKNKNRSKAAHMKTLPTGKRPRRK